MKRSPMPARTTEMPRGPGPLRNPDAVDGMFHRERRNAKRRKAARNTNAPAEVEALVLARATLDGILCCEICGKPLVGFRGRDWSIQHRLARAMGGSATPEVSSASNLIAVDGDGSTGCHGYIEAHPAEATANGWKVRHGVLKPAAVPVLLVHSPSKVLLDDAGGYTPAPEAAA